MIKVEEKEKIRRAYYVEKKSVRQIARELKYARQTVRKALQSAEPEKYKMKRARQAPVLGPYHERIKALLTESETMPPKQGYTSHRIYELIEAEGFTGSESTVRHYVAQVRQAKKRPKIYLPLEFDPGTDAQVDWGEADVILQGEQVTVQLFLMRLCYSRRLFVMAFPNQKQEMFFAGHVAAFAHFEGIPQRLTYDNLKTAVKKVLLGSEREEQVSFVALRSHYLFESHYCTPGAGHEKGRVEDGVGYVRRNFLTPLPRVETFAQLNEHLLGQCCKNDQRQLEGQSQTVHQAWQQERPHLRPLPAYEFDYATTKKVSLNGYGQVVVETNRYSVPADQAAAQLVVKIYPFAIKIFRPNDPEPIAHHPRCYGHKQDVFDPLHYLPLLQHRPGAFQHAKPIRRWREQWPAVYEQLLAHLQQQWPAGRGLRQFIQILKLHQDHPVDLIEQAVSQALAYQCAHLDGVQLCLRQLQQPEPVFTTLDLSDQPQLAQVGEQGVDLQRYDQLLGQGAASCL
ncbi:MAG: IS21 family transposase [Anaerolineae bacterium]|nr:IS21 family transposase [Anaerolineae bacterium]